ncbi:unnamed protein product, partial [Vitis vinifera]
MARWSQLPKDLLLLIAQRLNTHFDLLCLRSVCSSWHACVPSRPHPLPSRFPILPTNGTSWGLYLSRRTILCLGLPESHCQPTIGSWLIKVEEDVPDMAHLVNPLSTFQFKHLPPNFPKTFDFSRFRVSELGQEYVLQYMNHPALQRRRGELIGDHDVDHKLIVLDVGLKHCGPCVKVYPTALKLSRQMADNYFCKDERDIESNLRMKFPFPCSFLRFCEGCNMKDG